jgi:hypothetical protein
MSEKVQFQTNVSIDVALKYNDGKEVTGQYGDQVLYTLTDGRVMYVPPIVKKKIDELGIGRGELFTITKAEKKNGTRRTIEWVVGANDGGDRKPQTRAQQPNGQSPAQRRGGALSAPTNGDRHRPRSASEGKGFLVTGQGQFPVTGLGSSGGRGDCDRTLCDRVRSGAAVHQRRSTRDRIEHLHDRREVGVGMERAHGPDSTTLLIPVNPVSDMSDLWPPNPVPGRHCIQKAHQKRHLGQSGSQDW